MGKKYERIKDAIAYHRGRLSRFVDEKSDYVATGIGIGIVLLVAHEIKKPTISKRRVLTKEEYSMLGHYSRNGVPLRKILKQFGII